MTTRMNVADLDLLVKLPGVLGSKLAAKRDAAALAIERPRHSTGKTSGEPLRPVPTRRRIIITPWAANVPILMRGELPQD